jgi:Methyltransferase domain
MPTPPPNALRLAKRYYHSAFGHLASLLLRPGVVADAENFERWQRRGFHVTPVNFYQPIPDTRVLAAMPTKASPLTGPELSASRQWAFLESAIKPYTDEFAEFPQNRPSTAGYYINSNIFPALDGYAYYGVLRFYKPRLVIEIGSGDSSMLALQALAKNGAGRYMVIDPYPGPPIADNPRVEVICSAVESTDPALFDQLESADILFIDSTHVVKTAGDVVFLMLEVLPRLRPGVLIHIHDIFLPFDYPRDLPLKRRSFWSEQYLLHAYLTENDHVQILFGSHYMASEFPDRLRELLPSDVWIGGGSFWMQRI